MHKPLESLSLLQIALGSVLIVITGVLFRYFRIPLIKELIIASLRTVGQLLTIGYVLTFIFHKQDWYWIFLYLILMSLLACLTVRSRLTPKQKRKHFGAIQFSLWLGTGVTLIWISQFVLQVHPWYNPQFIIPLAGMLLGNSVTSASIALERFYSELEIRRAEVETLLSLGMKRNQAIQSCFKAGIMAGMIPNINAMMIVGIVSLPGMMTGQILAGQQPFQAVGYQIVVMFMITGASTLTLFTLLISVRQKVFNPFEQLSDPLF
jgi:putative ABC transport system permease protein